MKKTSVSAPRPLLTMKLIVLEGIDTPIHTVETHASTLGDIKTAGELCLRTLETTLKELYPR